jgi:hypothetical protein
MTLVAEGDKGVPRRDGVFMMSGQVQLNRPTIAKVGVFGQPKCFQIRTNSSRLIKTEIFQAKKSRQQTA